MLRPTPIPEQILCQIFQNEMTLAPDQTVIRDQNFKLPNDKRLYVALGQMSGYPISNVTEMVSRIVGEGDSAVTQFAQFSKLVMREDILIDVFSNDNGALFRRWEVIAALQSFYAQQKQEANYFKIFRIPRSFTNTSSAEGGSMINRYSIVVSCHVWYEKYSPLTNAGGGDYFDDFTTRVDDEKTIGTDKPLIEFEINEGGIV